MAIASTPPPIVLSRPAIVAPLAPERYKVQLTIGRETYDKLRRIQDLLRHSVPDGDPAAIFDRALTLLLADIERKKLSQTSRPRPSVESTGRSRHVSAAVRREVWERDGGQCAFVGLHRRCTERGLLEFHHVIPFADGGETTAGNLQLRCRAHNAYEADDWFGPSILRERQPGYQTALRQSALRQSAIANRQSPMEWRVFYLRAPESPDALEIQTRRQAQTLNPAAVIVSSQNHGSLAIRGSAAILTMCAITMRPNIVPAVMRKDFI